MSSDPTKEELAEMREGASRFPLQNGDLLRLLDAYERKVAECKELVRVMDDAVSVPDNLMDVVIDARLPHDHA